MNGFRATAPLLVAFFLLMCAHAGHAAPYTWVAWESANSTTATGTLNGVTVTFTGDLNPPAQVNGEGTNVWANSPSTYTSEEVDNPPPNADIVRLTGGPNTGIQTLTFSQPVVDPVMAILSLGSTSGGITYEFDAPFTILNNGPGFFGDGPLTQLSDTVLEGQEGHGIIRFSGTFTSISWTMPTAEFWHGFQIGIAGLAAPAPGVEATFSLTGSPGQTVTQEFPVDGEFPVALAAERGSVTPTELSGPGNAVYSLTIPTDTAIDTLIQDVITLTDADGITRVIELEISVVPPPDRDISGLALLTPNQRALAVWVDDVCPRLQDRGAQNVLEEDLLDVCGRLRDPDNLDTQVADALDAINPDQWMAATTVALRLTRVQHGNLAQRINSLRSGATGLDTSGLNVHVHGLPVPQEVAAELLRSMLGGGASADDLIGGEDFGRWGLFANGNINFGDQSRTVNQAGFDFNTLGITAGIDYRLRDNLFLGVAFGYANVDVDFARAGGDMDVDSWNLSLFGTWFQTDRYYVDALVNYGRNDYDSKRHIRFSDAQGLFERTAIGDANGKQLSAGLAAGYDFGRGPWTFGPHAGTDYLDVDIGRVREQGAGALNMIVGRQSAKSLTLNAGGHASYVYTATWGVFIPHLRLDYVRELETDRHLVDVRLAADPFANDPSNPSPTITLQSDRPDPSYFVWSIGASAQFVNGIAGFVNYQHMSAMNDFTLSQVNYGLRFERRF
jgi:outer membrane autotransporter protein